MALIIALVVLDDPPWEGDAIPDPIDAGRMREHLEAAVNNAPSSIFPPRDSSRWYVGWEMFTDPEAGELINRPSARGEGLL